MTFSKSVFSNSFKLLAFSLTFAIGFSLITAQSQAQSITEQDKAAIEEIVRDYILEHPEIIPEAVGILQARQEAVQQEQMRVAIAANQDNLLNDGFSIVGGNPEGDVTLVEFYDYRCPYCVQSHADVKRLLAEDQNLRIVYKQFPVKDKPGEDPASLTSARMAQAIAKQGTFLFEEFHDRVMDMNTNVSIADLGRVASEIGVDMSRLQIDIQEPAILDGIRNNFSLARDIGVTGTPSFVVGDTVLVGAQGYERMKAAIEQTRTANERVHMTE